MEVLLKAFPGSGSEGTNSEEEKQLIPQASKFVRTLPMVR